MALTLTVHRTLKHRQTLRERPQNGPVSCCFDLLWRRPRANFIFVFKQATEGIATIRFMRRNRTIMNCLNDIPTRRIRRQTLAAVQAVQAVPRINSETPRCSTPASGSWPPRYSCKLGNSHASTTVVLCSSNFQASTKNSNWGATLNPANGLEDEAPGPTRPHQSTPKNTS
jgi:hypothetical protein